LLPRRKSHIILEYAYRFRAAHPDSLILWVAAGSPSRLRSSFKILARKLSLPGGTNSPQFLKWLDENVKKKWLLLIDGAEEIGAFSETTADEKEFFWPRCYPQSSTSEVIVTTRNQKLGEELFGKDNLVTVPTLTNMEAATMLKSKVPIWNENDEHVLDVLGNLPLSIMLSGAYITDNEITVAKYRAELESMGNNDSVMRVCKLSFDQVQQENPRATDILQLSSILDRQGIPKLLLLEDKERPRPFNAALKTLQTFGLITTETDGFNFWIHDFVNDFTEKQIGNKQDWKEKALKLVSERFHYGNFLNWEICEMLLPQVQRVLELTFTTNDCLLQQAKIHSSLAPYESGQGNLKAAKDSQLKALAIRQKVLGDNSFDTMISRSEFAGSLINQGKYSQAEEESRRVLAFMKDKFGEENFFTHCCLNTLATSLDWQGKSEEAEKVFEKLVEGSTRVRGPADPFTLTYVTNWASNLSDQGKFAEAEEKVRQVLGRREVALGLDNQDTLGSLNNLGTILRKRAKYEEAEKTIRKALKLREKLLGLEHPDTLESRNTLAVTLRDLSRYHESEALQRENISQSQKGLGPDHPNTILYIANLGSLCDGMGRYQEARDFQLQALEKSKTVHGAGDPMTLSCQSNLALTFLRLGQYRESEEVGRQVLKKRKELLGDNHPDVIASMNNLAGALQRQGNYQEAEAIFRQTVNARETLQGPNHPLTMRAANNLAEVLRLQGQYEDAERLHRETLERRRNGLGPKHIDSLTSTYNLAHVLHQEKRHEEAKPMYEEALQGLKGVFGDNHPTTKDCQADFSTLLGEMKSLLKVGE